jgi:hypothetical protein
MEKTLTTKVAIEIQSIPKISISKNEDLQCRICFESEKGKNRLISPCKCSGSMKYVHEECLKLWILSSNMDVKSSSCELCRELFLMHVQLSRVCSLKNFNQECFNIFIFPVVIIIIGTIFAIVLLYLVRGLQEKSLQNEEKAYFSLVIFACSAIMTTLFFIFIKTICRGCCVIKMKTWHIQNLPEKPLDETFEVNHTTEINAQSENRSQNEITTKSEIILPVPHARYRGHNVIVPAISPETIARVNREAAVISRQQSHRSGNNTSRRQDFSESRPAQSSRE